MDVSIHDGVVLVEISGLSKTELDSLHNFLHDRMIIPVKKVELMNQAGNNWQGDGSYSACFTENQMQKLRSWLDEHKVVTNE